MNIRSAPWVGFALFCVLALGSCETNPGVAFPTGRALTTRAGTGPSPSIETLDHGRKIYTTRCTECHVARSIGNYSIERWRYYVNIMAPRAGLEPSDRAALEAYLIAARQSMPQG